MVAKTTKSHESTPEFVNVQLTSTSPVTSETLSTTFSDASMVEIKHDTPAHITQGEQRDPREAYEDSKHRLLYSRSRVYVQPTAFKRDNIPGFIALVKRESISPIYLLSWIPESLLDGRADWNKYIKAEKDVPNEDSDDEDLVLVEPPSRQGESYAFSVPLTSIYSLIVSPPTVSSWHGSISINLVNGSTLPTIYFHDDESMSLQAEQRASPNAPSWGGEGLLQKLRSYAHLMRSSLQSNLFLVDPSRIDVEAHSAPLFDDTAVDLILSHSTSSSPIPPLRRPNPPTASSQPQRYPPSAPINSSSTSPPSNVQSRLPSVLHQGLGSVPLLSYSQTSSARQTILSSFSQLTRATRHAAQNILSHPLAKPIVPHLPDPVRSLVNVQGETSAAEWAAKSWVEKGGVGEFESARVYLAKWARVVAEEGERARQSEAFSSGGGGGGGGALGATAQSGSDSEETSDLGVFELLVANSNLPVPKPTRDPRHPIDDATWHSWFEVSGKPRLTNEQFRGEVFRRGFTPSARRKAWPYLLEVVPWDATEGQRKEVLERKRAEYESIKAQWQGQAEILDTEEVIEERHRIDVDCRRTDRTQPLFMIPTTPTGSHPGTPGEKEDEEEQQYDDDGGAQSRTNEHVNTLGVILLTYNFYEKELGMWRGYVQGMSDLCAPLYVVCGTDEALTFWCLVAVMDRMKINFLRDQSGMKKQLSTLQQLLAVMDPELYRHFEKTDSLNLFFCFRWVLIAFKREFPFDEVLRLWEVLWTDYYTNQLVLFVALAVLESHRDVILRYLVEFDEVLKYCNELSMTIELDSTLAQAEVLFLSFSQIVKDIDRRQAEQNSKAEESVLRKRRGGAISPSNEGSSSTAAATMASAKAGKGEDKDPLADANLPTISAELRELLENWATKQSRSSE